MNNPEGLAAVLSDERGLNSIALCLVSDSTRTKIQVLDILSAVWYDISSV